MDGGFGNDLLVADNGDAVGGHVMIGSEGRDQVWADDSVAATGLHLNVYSHGTAVTPDIRRVPNTCAAIGVEYVLGSAGNDAVDASRLVFWQGMSFEGQAGDDVFVGSRGGDIFDGGADTDTFVTQGNRADYTFSTMADTANT